MGVELRKSTKFRSKNLKRNQLVDIGISMMGILKEILSK
jgi:hypothetical protein